MSCETLDAGRWTLASATPHRRSSRRKKRRKPNPQFRGGGGRLRLAADYPRGLLKVCLFTPTFSPHVGGAELDADLIARGLGERGHAVTVLTEKLRAGPPPADLPYPVAFYRRLFKQHRLPAAPALALHRLHKRECFDAVLAFYSYPCGYAAVRWGRRELRRGRRRPGIVLSPRGGDLYPNFHGLKKPGVAEVIAKGYRAADRIVSISSWISERLETVCSPHPLPPTTVVFNGLDLDAWDAEARGAEAIEPVVEGSFTLQLARVAPVKRQDLAVDAMEKLAGAYRERGLRHAIVGEGELLEPLRARVAERGLGDVVLLPGTIEGPAKSWLYHHARFFVSTSREEGLGNVTLEAMAAGLPMLASDIGPHRELIGDDPATSWGRLFASEKLDACVTAWRAMLDADLGVLRARALAERSSFTRAAMIDGYEAALEASVGDAAEAWVR